MSFLRPLSRTGRSCVWSRKFVAPLCVQPKRAHNLPARVFNQPLLAVELPLQFVNFRTPWTGLSSMACPLCRRRELLLAQTASSVRPLRGVLAPSRTLLRGGRSLCRGPSPDSIQACLHAAASNYGEQSNIASAQACHAARPAQSQSSESNRPDWQTWQFDLSATALFVLLCGCMALPGPAMAAGPQLDLAAEISPRTASLLASVSRPVLSLSIFLMLVRIVISWYPNVKGNKLPWAVAVLPTEFFLGPTRRAIPPVGGVDVAPIIWLAVFTFLNEILLGPQGILNLLQRKLEL